VKLIGSEIQLAPPRTIFTTVPITVLPVNARDYSSVQVQTRFWASDDVFAARNRGKPINVCDEATADINEELVRVLLEFGLEFFHINEALDDCGNTPLLLAVVSFRDVLEKSAMLLNRGAGVLARNKHGDSVLHLYLSSGYLWRKFEELRIYGGLRFLVRAGADSYAVNQSGVSVTCFACGMGFGKQWEDALEACGHNPAGICGTLYRDYRYHGRSRCEVEFCYGCLPNRYARRSKDPNESEDGNTSLSEDDSDESESEELSEVAESFAEHSADDEESVVEAWLYLIWIKIDWGMEWLAPLWAENGRWGWRPELA
jgi:hypothetical protein